MKTASVLVALGIFACNTQSPNSGEVDPILAQARAAILALEGRDASEVQACEADVRSCFEALPDAGAAGACEALSDQCREAKDGLDDVRAPVVDCWHQVEACVERGKAFPEGDAGVASADAGAACSVKPGDCQDMGHDADEDRNPVLECRSEVRECLQSVRQQRDWRAECGEAREACSEICGLAGRAMRERRPDRAEGARERVRHLLDGLRQRRHGGGGGLSDPSGHDAPDERDAGRN